MTVEKTAKTPVHVKLGVDDRLTRDHTLAKLAKEAKVPKGLIAAALAPIGDINQTTDLISGKFKYSANQILKAHAFFSDKANHAQPGSKDCEIFSKARDDLQACHAARFGQNGAVHFEKKYQGQDYARPVAERSTRVAHAIKKEALDPFGRSVRVGGLNIARGARATYKALVAKGEKLKHALDKQVQGLPKLELSKSDRTQRLDFMHAFANQIVGPMDKKAANVWMKAHASVLVAHTFNEAEPTKAWSPEQFPYENSFIGSELHSALSHITEHGSIANIAKKVLQQGLLPAEIPSAPGSTSSSGTPRSEADSFGGSERLSVRTNSGLSTVEEEDSDDDSASRYSTPRSEN